MSVNDNNKNRGAHGVSSSMLDTLVSLSENPLSLDMGSVNEQLKNFHCDGFVNMLNKYGTSKDSSEQYEFVSEPLYDDSTITAFYEGNGLFSKIIDTPAEEAIKNGFELEGLSDKKLEAFYYECLDELDWEETVMTAVKWARLYGGSIAVLLVNDGNDDLSKPLDWDNIQSIDDIRVYDRSLVEPDYVSMYSYSPENPFKTRGSRMGMPEYYNVNSRFGSFRVHESRCLVFQNGVMPENSSNVTYQFWGMPEYAKVHKCIRDAEIAHGSSVKMLDRSVQPVYKMKDLSAELATEEGEDRVLKRLETIDMSRGMLNTITVDSEGEDYDFRTFAFSGIADVIDSTCNLLSAVTSIPQTILFGRSPSGMNSTGASDMENWYNYLQRIQNRMIKPNLRYLLSIIFQAGLATGEIDKAPKIKIKFKPLWSLTEEQELEVESKKIANQLNRAKVAEIYYGMNSITAPEIREGLAKQEALDIEKLLDEFEKETLFPEGKPEYTSTPQQVEQSAPNNNLKAGVGSAPAIAPEATKIPKDMSKNLESNETNDDEEPKKEKGNLRTEDIKHTDEEPKPRGSVGVIVIKNGKILTAMRHTGEGTGTICGPGGHIDGNEIPREAAYRETEEEFGIRPKELIYIGRGYTEENGNSPYIYICTKYEGTPHCTDGNGILEMSNEQFLSEKEIKYYYSDRLFKPFAYSLDLLNNVLQGKPMRKAGKMAKEYASYRHDK